jgi:hypothetical protein
VGDYQGVGETVAKLKTDAVVIGTGLGFSFSSLSIAEWAAIFTIFYTLLKIGETVYGWVKKKKK